jgi:hypothetical protein
MCTVASTDNARELELFAINDRKTYMESLTPIMDNMDKKRRKGIFDQEKAVKAFMYSAEFAARRYCAEFGGVWNKLFNAATRRLVAELFLDNYLADVL